MAMNRTQKGALFNLSGFVVNVILLGYILLTILVFQRLPNRWALLVLLLLVGVYFGAWGFVLRGKQSPAEPEADERDKAIMKNGVLVSFIAVWLFLAAATVVPTLVLGAAGSVPVYVLTFVNFGVFLAAGLVYFAAVLIQYGRGVKDEQ